MTSFEPGDVVVDGGNSHYHDSMLHGAALGEDEIMFVDAGVSGGIWGREEGYALMVGGAEQAAQTGIRCGSGAPVGTSTS